MGKICFLIRNRAEHSLAQNIIQREKVRAPIILSLSDEYPFITNHCSHMTDVGNWSDFNVSDTSLTSYWLRNYKQIESDAAKELKHVSCKAILDNQYFLMGLVWEIGNIQACVDELCAFFEQVSPDVIYFDPVKTTGSDLLLSLIGIHGLVHRTLGWER